MTLVDSGATASYIYNAEGARVHENVGGTVEEFLNGSGPQSLTIVDGSQNLFEADYSFGGRPLATANSGGLSFAATDTLGTVRARLNASGAILESDTSWPYGEFRNYSNAISRIHFTGKLDDTESGLDYFGARYYASSLGRFMSPDAADSPEAAPFADLEDPQSLNLYSFVANNPATVTDPDGHDPPDCKEQTPCKPLFSVTVVASAGDCCALDLPSPGQILQQFADFLGDVGAMAATSARAAAATLALPATVLSLSESTADAAHDEPEELEAKQIADKAATATGNESATASSREVAEKAAQKFVGDKSIEIPQKFGNRAGQIIGRKSADGMKIFRDDGDHFNLESKSTGGNLHVTFPGGR